MVSAHHPEEKAIEFIQCLINFEETSKERPNYILKWGLHKEVPMT